MAHLIRTLVGREELDRLPEVYAVLAKAYLDHRAGGRDLQDLTNFTELRQAVLSSEAPVPVGRLRDTCDLIATEIERPVELFNNLGQIEVLILSIQIIRNLGLDPLISAPTQQSKDKEGNDIADLQGEGWSLEAYGGQKCDSNMKIYEDICTLKQNFTNHRRLFLSFRRSAWTAFRKQSLEPGVRAKIQGKTKKARPHFGNEKVRVSAELNLVGEVDGICVCEVFHIETEPPLAG